MSLYPRRIVCLTEESVEILFALGEGHRIVGVSAYVERPEEAKALPKVTAFVSGHIKKIVDLRPDLVIGFSDIQKDLARDLIEQGLNVFIANHRSIDEILDYTLMIGRLVGAQDKAEEYVKELKEKIDQALRFSSSLKARPRIYIEEWDEPMIAGIHWFNEIVELCGGELIFPNSELGPMAKDRYIQSQDVIERNPDIILACWCGKKVNVSHIKEREGWRSINAVRDDKIYELKPEIFLQPGPAPIISGIDILLELVRSNIS